MMAKSILLTLLLAFTTLCKAQELKARITVNHSQVQGTDDAVFKQLEEQLTQWFNDKQWTTLQFQPRERIQCSFNITVTKYDAASNAFTCRAIVQATRPVYGASYTTTLFANTDKDFNFSFSQFDQLNFQDETVDNSLTALMAYYAYLIIGIDLDSFSPMGGTDVLQRCMNLVNNAQNLNATGWKSFESSSNRFALINDYIDGAMTPFRQLQYDYYRKGLDTMAENPERGRAEIGTAITTLLSKCHEDKPMSILPQMWTDYKRDELANIYEGKGNAKEKENIRELLFRINPSQSNAWDKITK